jgi:citrate synthase
MLVQMAEQQGVAQALGAWLASGHALQGFGHPLYPQGDARAQALLARFDLDPVMVALRDAVIAATGQLPNIDFALAAMTRALGLPPQAPFLIFAQARSVGWVAHAIEQVSAGSLIRPRARYEGALLQQP